MKIKRGVEENWINVSFSIDTHAHMKTDQENRAQIRRNKSKTQRIFSVGLLYFFRRSSLERKAFDGER